MSEPPQRPGRDPLALLCLAMLAGGLMLALSGFDSLFERWFGYWRERGVAQFSHGVLDTRLDGLVATMAGILGGSLVGKWLAAWWLAREAPPREHAWSLRALLASLVGFGLFEFVLLQIWGVPTGEASAELMVPIFAGLMLTRERGEAPSVPLPARSLAWRCLEIFAWLNVALGLSLSALLFTPVFAIYRESMAALWFPDAAPLELDAWLRYGYGAIGAAFAGQFLLLAAVARHAAGTRWAWRIYAVTLLAWFAVDSAACLLHGAWFNVLQINLPAILSGGALLAWAAATDAKEQAQA